MKKYVLFFLLPAFLFAQEGVTKKIVRDTSYTVNSTNQKILKQYPDVTPVEKALPAGISTSFNIVYSDEGARKLHLDLFMPKEKKKSGRAAILFIHGGGWRSGDRTMDHQMAAKMASLGYVTAAVEYKLSTEALYPEAIYNVKAAVKWIKENAKKYNINKNKIVLMGSSAGGQIAALAGVTTGLSRFEKNAKNKTENTKVQAVVDVDGVFDMTTPEESGKDTVESKPSAVKQWLGVKYKDNPALWIEASPLTYINKSTPPVLFINSSFPRFHAGRDQAIEKMNKLNIYSEVHTIAGTPHGFWFYHPWFDEMIEHTEKFLKKVL
jgi:acetyl esterase/lipase